MRDAARGVGRLPLLAVLLAVAGSSLLAPAPARGQEPGLEAAADSAWRAGTTDRARDLYARILAADSADGRALHRMALMRAWEEDYEASLALFDRLLALQPSNLSARVDRARVLAWKGDLDGAVRRLDRLLEEHPEHLGALEAQARFASWRGDVEAALEGYDRVDALGGGGRSLDRERARLLSWADRLETSMALYDSLVRTDPEDVEARLGLGRVLAWRNRFDSATAVYRSVLERSPGDRRARAGLARVAAWKGDLVRAEELWRALVREEDPGAEALAGLARTLRWQGRPAAAAEVLERAEGPETTGRAIREERIQLRLALAPEARPGLSRATDSDGNEITTARLSASGRPLPRLSVRGDVYRRWLEDRVRERRASGGSVGASVHLEPGWTVSAGVGAAGSDDEASEAEATWSLGLATPPRHRLSGRVSVDRRVVDETAALAATGVTARQASGSLTWRVAPGWRVGAGGSLAEFRGTEDNERRAGSVSGQRRLGPDWTLVIAARAFGFEKDLNDGYFDPDFYGQAEATVRWSPDVGPWRFTAELSPGLQQVGSDGDVQETLRATGRVAYEPAPGRRVELGGHFSRAGLQSFASGASDYEYRSVSLSAVWTF